nr:hypothetical protein [Tanacetum cinerariifolium]
TGKVHILPVRPQPVPTGKPKVTPVPTGKPKVTAVPNGKPKVTPVPTGKPKETLFSATEDEGIFDSGCSRSMTGNKERLDDFHAFHGGKVTFGGGEGRITRKGTIHTECLVLSKDFKLPDDSMVVLKVPRKHNLYTINLNDLCPMGNLACLVAHAFFDESVKWHRQMAHVNYKNINRLVKGNLVRGLPPKLFKDGHTCIACCNKQHKASYKAINVVSSISEPLQLLHMDLFRPTSIRSIGHKYYCLVITDDYSRFCWVFFLAHKDETYHILKDFINLVENQLNKKVKAIRCDNGIEFKNEHMIELCGSKGIKRNYSNPRTLQQNGVAERKNKTLIEAARTMLADSNHFKPFGCHVTILYTSDHLDKFDGKADEGYIVGYSASNKAYRGLGHEWYFDLDYLTDSLGYKHVSANQPAGTQGATTNSAGTQDANSDSDCDEQVIIVPSYPSLNIQQSKPKDTSGDKVDDSPLQSTDEIFQKELASATPVPPGCIPVPTGKVPVPTGGLPVPTGSIPVPAAAIMVLSDDVSVHTSSSNDSMFDGEPTTRFPCPSNLGNHDPSPGIFSSSSYDDEFDNALNNAASSMERDNHIDFQHCLLACFLSQVEPRSVAQALENPSWVDAMQEEMQQFKFQNVWVLVDLPAGKYAIRTKWILKNKRDARGIVVRNKARLVAQSAFLYERIDEEVYVTQPKGCVDPQHPKKVYKVVKALYGLHQAPRAWYANLSTFLLKHGYRRGTIDKTLFLKKNNRDIILVQVYVDDIIFGSTKKAWCDEFEALMKGEFQMSAMGEVTFFLGLQVQQRPDGIFIHQNKYVQEILNKFDLGSVKTVTTPYEATKPKSKTESNSPVNIHLYRSMICSLMYLTTSRLDIMFAVSACSRHQVTSTTSNLEAVKKIFNDSDYTGASKDRKSTTGGCQFLGRSASVPSGIARVPTGSGVFPSG